MFNRNFSIYSLSFTTITSLSMRCPKESNLINRIFSPTHTPRLPKHQAAESVRVELTWALPNLDLASQYLTDRSTLRIIFCVSDKIRTYFSRRKRFYRPLRSSNIVALTLISRKQNDSNIHSALNPQRAGFYH